MGFQNLVNRQPAPAVEGAIASANPRASMLAGDSALVSGANGVTVGRFAFARNDNGQVGNVDPGAPYRVGFVGLSNPVLITAWLGGASMLLQPGIEVTLFVEGDFWGRFVSGAAVIGQKVFASLTDGTLKSAAAGASVAGSIETNWFVLSACLTGELAKISTRGPN